MYTVCCHLKQCGPLLSLYMLNDAVRSVSEYMWSTGTNRQCLYELISAIVIQLIPCVEFNVGSWCVFPTYIDDRVINYHNYAKMAVDRAYGSIISVKRQQKYTIATGHNSR